MERNREQSRIFDACSLILIRETKLVDTIAPLQARLREVLVNRKWMDYEGLNEAMTAIGVEFEALEAERIELFRKLAGNGHDESERFYTIAARLPEAERVKLGALYRSLKMKALQVKVNSRIILDYINETKNLITGALESAYPDRKGKLYSRTGSEREADMKSVVVNRSF